MTDLAVSFELARATEALRGVKLQVNATNLFNKRYVSYCANISFCSFGLSLTGCASLKYDW